MDRLDGATYERLLARGFRRCGRTIYRPRCRACNECRQLRVPVAEFTPTRSMRRIARRNADVHVEVGDPNPTHGKFVLFTRYLDAQHDATMPRNYESFVEFLYDSPLRTDEIRYYLGRHLIGVTSARRSVVLRINPHTRRIDVLGTLNQRTSNLAASRRKPTATRHKKSRK